MGGGWLLRGERRSGTRRFARGRAMLGIGLTLGGKPIDDYAPDFWLISGAGGGAPVGYVTSPWYSPELGTTIAMGYVPWDMRAIGTTLKIHLPDEYAETPGVPIKAEVVEIPFRPSITPSARELAKTDGRDTTF